MRASVSFLSASVFVLLFNLHVSGNHKQLHWAAGINCHCTEPIKSLYIVQSNLWTPATDFQILAIIIVPDKPNFNADIGMSVCVLLTVSMSFDLLTCKYIFSLSILRMPAVLRQSGLVASVDPYIPFKQQRKTQVWFTKSV